MLAVSELGVIVADRFEREAIEQAVPSLVLRIAARQDLEHTGARLIGGVRTVEDAVRRPLLQVVRRRERREAFHTPHVVVTTSPGAEQRVAPLGLVVARRGERPRESRSPLPPVKVTTEGLHVVALLDPMEAFVLGAVEPLEQLARMGQEVVLSPVGPE